MDHRPCLGRLPGPRLPPTPESVAEPTFLPHVRAPLTSLQSASESECGKGGFSITACAFDPVDDECSPASWSRGPLAAGLNVLLHSRDALADLHHLYATSSAAQEAFAQAVAVIADTVRSGGRFIISGIGKSGKIGEKLVATCNSLGVRAMYIHAADAVHGDLGGMASNDAILLISNSARTPELVAMVPHLPPSLPLMVMTAAMPALPSTAYPSRGGSLASDSSITFPRQQQISPPSILAAHPLFAHRSDEGHFNLVLPAPIPVSEIAAFGVPAPTTSTSVALALGDALAIAASDQLHGPTGMAEVFRKGHPGGCIGKNL